MEAKGRSGEMRIFARSAVFLWCALLFLPGQSGGAAAQSAAAEKAAPAASGVRAPATAGAPAGTTVPQRRLAHLRHGVNISDWLAQVYAPNGYTKEHFDTTITPHDLDLIQAMGFDHVRLSVDPRPLLRTRQSEQIREDQLVYLDAAVKMILDRGLAVDISIFANEDFKTKLASDDEFVEQFADFWRALAKHYANLDADRVFFEILNEPEGKDSLRWSGIETKVAAAIREGAPENTIIATGAHWSNDDDLVALEPLPDANVIYAFHFYEAHIFTHQGATWSVNYWHELKAVPYPSTPENVQEVAAELPDAAHRLAVVRYGFDRWNAQRIEGEIGQVAEWAEHWGVPVICNEFGVYRKYADPKDRLAWLGDVRSALEKHGIGWATWEYHGGFGVVTTENGETTPDEATARALGLPPQHTQDRRLPGSPGAGRTGSGGTTPAGSE